jgi:hypothetical protein
MSIIQTSRMVRVCMTCGHEFSVYASSRNASKFCSAGCYNAHRTRTLEECFRSQVGATTESGCILWNGYTNKDRYGIVSCGSGRSRRHLAHRVAYAIAFGPIANDVLVLHECDNPPCVNAAHLFLGSIPDNMADKVSKSRQPRGEEIPWAKLTAASAAEIRRLYSQGGATYDGLASAFGVSYNTVRCVVKGTTWKHV